MLLARIVNIPCPLSSNAPRHIQQPFGILRTLLLKRANAVGSGWPAFRAMRSDFSSFLHFRQAPLRPVLPARLWLNAARGFTLLHRGHHFFPSANRAADLPSEIFPER